MEANDFFVVESLVLLLIYGLLESYPDQCDTSSAQRVGSKRYKKENSVRFTYSENQMLSFARVLCLLNSMFLLRNGAGAREATCTERDLYYCNPPLFAPQGQRAVHRSLQRLGVWMRFAALCVKRNDGLPQRDQCAEYRFIFTTPQTALERIIATDGHQQPYSRENLGVVATPKSIFVGPLSMILCPRQNGAAAVSSPIQVRCDGDGVQLTTEMALYSSGYSVGDGSREVALVFVEKESTLCTLLNEIREQQESPGDVGCRGRPMRPGRSYLMLCTKGYPCVASRLFLRRLYAYLPQLPLFALVDGDPHGLRILLTMLESNPPGSSFTKEYMGNCDKMDSSFGVDRKSGLLPLQWVGLRPSTMSTHHLSRASLMPLSVSDGGVLRQLEQRISGHLAGEIPLHPSVRATLSCILEEIRWMWRTRLKGELQACKYGLLSLLEDFLLPMSA